MSTVFLMLLLCFFSSLGKIDVLILSYNYILSSKLIRMFRIDAEESRRLVKFANHYNDANCFMRLVQDGCDNFPCLFAKKNISAGEELVWNYGFHVNFKV